MKTLLSCALIAGGAFLIFLGLAAAPAIGPGLFRVLTCSAADRTIWMLVVGMIATAGGAGCLLQQPRPTGPTPVALPL